MRWLLLLPFLAAGCTNTTYQRWADRQVAALVAERAEATLGYVPDTDLTVPTDTDPGTSARRYTPMTVRAVDAPVPIEVAEETLPEGPLGPPTTLGPLTDTAVEASQLAEQLAVMALQFGP
ncbi:MAG: hypothetical protein AAF743_08190, partial [Planctomycetota bacterium]